MKELFCIVPDSINACGTHSLAKNCRAKSYIDLI